MSSTLRIPTARAFLPLLPACRYKGAYGGRGSGKSHFFAEMLVERCVLNPGTRAACVREVQKSLKNSVKLLVEDKIKSLGLSGFHILETEIKTPGDGIIIFQGMQNHTSDSIKSLEGFDVAWVEEAQTLSQRSLDLLRPTLRKAGSELWFSWNPDKASDPVDAFLRGEHPPRESVVVRANYGDNPWLPDELRDDLRDDKERDPDKFANVWNGDYALAAKARVFRKWTVREFTTPADAVHRFGADWGFATDPTVLVRSHIDGRTLYVDAEAYAVGCEVDYTPALFAGNDTEKLERGEAARWENPRGYEGIAGARKFLIRADSARPETVSYMQRKGFRMTPAIKGTGSVEDGIEFLRAFDIAVHPRCVHVAQELALYSYKIDPHTEEILPLLEDKNNHTIDALRYALEELRRSGYKPAAQLPKPRPRRDYGFNDRPTENWKTA